jgi:hypothetical protein
MLPSKAQRWMRLSGTTMVPCARASEAATTTIATAIDACVEPLFIASAGPRSIAVDIAVLPGRRSVGFQPDARCCSAGPIAPQR